MKAAVLGLLLAAYLMSPTKTDTEPEAQERFPNLQIRIRLEEERHCRGYGCFAVPPECLLGREWPGYKSWCGEN